MQSQPYPVQAVRKRFWIAVTGTVLTLLFMRFFTGGLTARSIIEFEMAKTPERAQALMNSWNSEGATRFVTGIYFDFVFIACYTAALFFGCRFMGYLSGHDVFRKAGTVFSFLAILAGICDTLENSGMIYTIKQQAVPWVVHFTYDMAFVKFSLIFIALLFMLICLFFWGIDKITTANKKITP